MPRPPSGAGSGRRDPGLFVVPDPPDDSVARRIERPEPKPYTVRVHVTERSAPDGGEMTGNDEGAATVEAAPGVFDYGSLDAATRTTVEACRDDIQQRGQRATEDIIGIGRSLSVAREAISSDRLFGQWREAEFGMSRSSAARFMSVFRTFGNLPAQFGRVDRSALYALASGDVSEEVRQRFIDQAESGLHVKHRDVRGALAAIAAETAAAPEPVTVRYTVVSEPSAPSAPMAVRVRHVLSSDPTVEPKQTESTSLADLASGDDAEARRLFTQAFHQTMRGIFLVDPEEGAGLLRPRDVEVMRQAITSARDWLDRFEALLDRVEGDT